MNPQKEAEFLFWSLNPVNPVNPVNPQLFQEPNTFAEICGCPKCLSVITILTNGFEQANLRAQLRAFGYFWRLKNCYSEIFKNNWFIQKVRIIVFFNFLKTPENKGYILVRNRFKYELLTPISRRERSKTRFSFFVSISLCCFSGFLKFELFKPRKSCFCSFSKTKRS